MTSKKAIKKMMAVGIPRDTARLWSGVGTALRLTNESVAMMAIHCEGKRPAEIYSEIYSMEVVLDEPQDRLSVIRRERGTVDSWELVRV